MRLAVRLATIAFIIGETVHWRKYTIPVIGWFVLAYFAASWVESVVTDERVRRFFETELQADIGD